MQSFRHRVPQTEGEHKLLAAYEHELTVLLALSSAPMRNHKAGPDMDERRFVKVRRRAVDAARVRVASLAAYIEREMPAVVA